MSLRRAGTLVAALALPLSAGPIHAWATSSAPLAGLPVPLPQAFPLKDKLLHT